MSFSEDSSDVEWNNTNLNKKKPQANASFNIKRENASFSKKRYFHKFHENWLTLFHPWLARCDDDPNRPYCKACERSLDCNRFRLQRHERTLKHVGNMEDFDSKGEDARENQERITFGRQKSAGSTQSLKGSKPNNESDVDFSDEYSELERINTKPKLKTPYRTWQKPAENKPKYVHKFCDKWLTLFEPWLARCEDDPNKPFCKACNRRLDCNRCRLQRHEATTKHMRNMELFVYEGEDPIQKNANMRQESRRIANRVTNEKKATDSKPLTKRPKLEEASMEFSENSSDLDWNTTRSEDKKPQHNESIETKYFHKFCAKWLTIFQPWLARCADDPNRPFCKACQCSLDCNRSHLERHERCSKHIRNVQVYAKERQSSSTRQGRHKYQHQRKKPAVESIDMGNASSDEFIEETTIDHGTPFHFVHTGVAASDQYNEESIIAGDGEESDYILPTHSVAKKQSPASSTRGKRLNILKQIQKDRNDLMGSFKELIDGPTFGGEWPPLKERNHVDLFFDSVSSTVKALSPDLIAESKMRVSQVICELELRQLARSGAAGAANDAAIESEAMPDSSGTKTYIIHPPESNHSDEPTPLSEQHFIALS